MSIYLTQGKYFGQSLRSREDDFIKYSITTYSSHSAIAEHYHQNAYISLLIRGCYIEKTKTGDTQLQAGSIICRQAAHKHSNEFEKEGGTCFNIEIKKNPEQLFDFDFKSSLKSIICKPGSLPSIYKLLDHFTRGFHEDTAAELVWHVLQEAGQELPKQFSLNWINTVKQILKNETELQHSIFSLSRKVFVHPVYLARAFKQKTGFTIGHYQLKMKVEKAFELLTTTNWPINKIAFRTGFYDAAHFTRSFRFFYSTTPFRLRELLKG